MAGLIFLADVNVLVANHDLRHPHHELARKALRSLFDHGDRLALTSVSMSGATRVLSYTTYREALDRLVDVTRHLSELAASPATVMLAPGARHWPLFRTMIDTGHVGHKVTTDAWFAALAIEHDATLITFDDGFARFEPFGLHWRHLTA